MEIKGVKVGVMEYHIFCNKTHKLLAIYTNKETLIGLDISRCYYKEVRQESKYIPKGNDHLNPFSTHGRNLDYSPVVDTVGFENDL